MLDDLPNARLAVYIFLEMMALGFALEAVAAFMRGDSWWKWTGALMMGIVFMVLGIKSAKIVEKLSRYFNSRLIWMAAFGVFSLYSLYFLQRLEFAMKLHERLHAFVFGCGLTGTRNVGRFHFPRVGFGKSPSYL